MCSTNEISQTAGLGAFGNTFIGQQDVHQGLSVGDAVDIAFRLFHEYYPKFKAEALADVKQEVENYLKGVSPQNITSPSPRIAVPALQNASITEEHEIRKMYAALLAKSMNSVVKKGVHPGFVEVIKQISPDEAKVLKYLSLYEIVPTITLRRENDKGQGMDVVRDFSDIGEKAGCETPYAIKSYFDNLIRLGILEASKFSSLTKKSLYDPIKKHPFIVARCKQIEAQTDEYNKVKFTEGFMSLSDYGNSFCNICLDNVIVFKVKA